eukprot:4699682-Prymnesium_polylepis.1
MVSPPLWRRLPAGRARWRPTPERGGLLRSGRWEHAEGVRGRAPPARPWRAGVSFSRSRTVHTYRVNTLLAQVFTRVNTTQSWAVFTH